MAEIYKYVKTLREDDIELILLEESDMPIASSVVAREKAKLQEQIQNIVNSLNNYFLKTETYSKEEVNGLFEQLTGLGIEFKEVQTLPAIGENKYIYLLSAKDSQDQDIYEEYIYIRGAWERIGSTAVNLADYYTKKEIDDKLATKGGLSSANTWSGANNFTGNLTKNGVNVAIESQIPKVDSTLSTTSTNAIQNKAVKTELDKKGGKSTANTWSANNNFTGGLQKNGVDVATTTQVNQKITMPTALEGGYLKYTQEKGAHWALVESSGSGGNSSGSGTDVSKDIYLLKMDLGLTTANLERSVVNNLLKVTEDLKAGNILIDELGNIYKITQLWAGNDVEYYKVRLVNAGSYGKVVYFINTEITDINNYPQEQISTKYPNGSYIMDSTGKVYQITEFVPNPSLPEYLPGSYKLALICNPSSGSGSSSGSLTVDTELSETSENPVQNKVITAKFTELENQIGSGGNSTQAPTPLKTGDAYPKFIYFDTSQDITSLLAGLTYPDNGVNIIMEIDEGTYLVSLDIGAFAVGSQYAGYLGYGLGIINQEMTGADILFISETAPDDVLTEYRCVRGWNQRLTYTDYYTNSSKSIAVASSNLAVLNIMYGEDINTDKNTKTVKGDFFKVFSGSMFEDGDFGTPEAIKLIARTTYSFFKTAKHCDERICCVNGVGAHNSKSIYSIVHEAEMAGVTPLLFSSPIFLSIDDNHCVMLNLTMAYNNTTNYCQITTQTKNLM